MATLRDREEFYNWLDKQDPIALPVYKRKADQWSLENCSRNSLVRSLPYWGSIDGGCELWGRISNDWEKYCRQSNE